MAKRFSLGCKGFGGLDQRAGVSTAINSFPFMENFTVETNGHLRVRCGYGDFAEPIHGDVSLLWSGNVEGEEYVLAYGNGMVYRLAPGIAGLMGEIEGELYSFVPFAGAIYCLGDNFYKMEDSLATKVEGYAPIVMTAATPDCKSGTALEAPNVITGLRRVRYSGDDTATTYSLPEKNVLLVRSVTVNGEVLQGGYTAQPNFGQVVFDSAPPAGVNNVEICYKAAAEESKSKIVGCRYGAVFNNRLFLYGNPNYPNYLFHSELGDGIPTGEYFTDTGYHVFEKEVRSVAPCFGRLLIFCEDGSYFTYPELKTDTLGNTYTSFPLYELNGDKGSLLWGNAPSMGNTPVTLCPDGFNKWVSTEIADERNALVFSERVFGYAAAMAKEPESVKAYCRKAKNELWFVYGDEVIIYNYGTDRFYRHKIGPITALCEYGDGMLLSFGDGSGKVYLFSDDYDRDGDLRIKASFSTPYCTFGEPYLSKSLDGIALSVEGTEDFSASLSFTRGNGNERLDLPFRVYLPGIEEGGYRMFRTRLKLKRFYSCRLTLSTLTPRAELAELHLLGKSADRSLRAN